MKVETIHLDSNALTKPDSVPPNPLCISLPPYIAITLPELTGIAIQGGKLLHLRIACQAARLTVKNVGRLALKYKRARSNFDQGSAYPKRSMVRIHFDAMSFVSFERDGGREFCDPFRNDFIASCRSVCVILSAGQ